MKVISVMLTVLSAAALCTGILVSGAGSMLTEGYAEDFLESSPVESIPIPMGNGEELALCEYLALTVPLDWGHFGDPEFDFSADAIKRVLQKSELGPAAAKAVGAVGRYVRRSEDGVLFTREGIKESVDALSADMLRYMNYTVSDYDMKLIDNLYDAVLFNYDSASELVRAMGVNVSALRILLSAWLKFGCYTIAALCFAAMVALSRRSMQTLLQNASIMLASCAALLTAAAAVSVVLIGIADSAFLKDYSASALADVFAVAVCLFAALTALNALLIPYLRKGAS